MLAADLPLVPPTDLAAEDLVIPTPLSLSFEGFGPEAFAILDRLKAHGHIERYREEKEGIRMHLTEPFKRYRDDLVVNWVLPNRLDYETEKNVFSRLLKNDFGAGGCHHHLWMAFYRPGRRRLTDAQLSHSLSPDGLDVGLFVGDYARDLLEGTKRRVAAQPERFLSVANPLLQRGWRFSYYLRVRKEEVINRHEEPLAEIPDDIGKAKGVWFRRLLPREDVLRLEGDLVRHALEQVRAVWPLYRLVAAA